MSSYKFLEGGGEMGALTRAHDWASTSLGSPEFWPQSLRTSISTVLNTQFPMFFYWGPELICFYNDAYRPSLGINGKHPDMFGQPAHIFWAEIWHILDPLIKQVLSGGGATWHEDQLIPFYRNGHIEDIYWTFSYSPVIDESGEPGGILVACTETTDKVLTLNAIKQNEEDLRFTLDAAEMGTFDLDPITKTVTGNARLKSWFGVPIDEPLELADALNTIVEKDRDRVSEAIGRALSEPGYTYDIAYSIINSIDKKERKVRVKGKSLFDENGTCYRFTGTIQDQTEEIKAQEDLLKTNYRLAIALEAGALGSYEMNLLTGKFDCDKQCRAHFGVGETAGFSFQDLLATTTEDSRVQLQARLSEAVQQKSIFNTECPVKWPDGTIHWIRISGKPNTDEDDNGQVMVGITTDITEQKQLHQQKDDFIGIASHELRTPITSLKGYTQVMEKMMRKKGELLEAGMLAKMDAQINRITSLISDLLDVTKINSGRLQLKNTLIDFNQMVEEVIEELQRTTERHTLKTDLHPTGIIYADRERISQVLINLITNAIKYSPNADSIIISTNLEDNQINVCVEDFGIGITEENKEKVFEQFYRVSGDKQHTFPGLGLGLYISSEIIKRTGGRLWVNSKAGQGSTFCFSIPVDQGPTEPDFYQHT
ncbi:MAG: yycG 3 [Ferruginibacter sp.]|nr:yycG 3 [Ferruginibacter sp.]